MRSAGRAILNALLGPRGQLLEPPARIVVGLGNPGGQYAETRHNIGFWCVDRLARDRSITLDRRHRSALVGEGAIEGHRVVLAKPRTFVNRSGQTVSYLLARYRVSPKKLLVIYDDMDLPVGKIRLRLDGGAGGHNGMKSIIETVGSQDFPRLRVGIGRPPSGSAQVEYVLGNMSNGERKLADEGVERAVEAVECVVGDGITVAMNRFN